MTTITDKPAIYRSHRHTVCGGRIVTFAEGFLPKQGRLGPRYEAFGPYEISASRNGVEVHHAALCTAKVHAAFLLALEHARITHIKLLECDGRPNDMMSGEPQPLTEKLWT